MYIKKTPSIIFLFIPVLISTTASAMELESKPISLLDTAMSIKKPIDIIDSELNDIRRLMEMTPRLEFFYNSISKQIKMTSENKFAEKSKQQKIIDFISSENEHPQGLPVEIHQDVKNLKYYLFSILEIKIKNPYIKSIFNNKAEKFFPLLEKKEKELSVLLEKAFSGDPLKDEKDRNDIKNEKKWWNESDDLWTT